MAMHPVMSPTVARWIALLEAGVPLEVPPRDIPYQDTHRATLRWLGREAFERADEWTAFEAGHGHYGGTERSPLEREEVLALLASLEGGAAERVKPARGEPDGPDRVLLSEVIPRVLDAEVVLTAWLDPDARGGRDVVLGDAGALLWIRIAGAKLERVERLGSRSIEAVGALALPGSAIEAVCSEHRELASRSRERLAREEAIFEALSDRARALRHPRSATYVARGAQLPWLAFWEDPAQARPYVCDVDVHAVRAGIARALADDPACTDEPVPEALAGRVADSERTLVALHDELAQGLRSLQRNTSVAMHWIWVDGIGCEVYLDPQGAVASVERVERLRPDPGLCASLVQQGREDPRTRLVEPELLAALRAWIAG